MRSSKQYRLDSYVARTLGIFLVVALAIFGFRMYRYQDCSATGFHINADEFLAGKIITFSDASKGAKEWEWDFGDKSAPSRDRSPLHVYKFAGEYPVKLTINGSCEKVQRLVIYKDAPIVDSTQYPVVQAPVSATVGRPVHFIDATPSAKKWEWSFGESGKIDSRVKTPWYDFRTPGVKTVTLIINGREQYRAIHRITILAKPLGRPGRDFSGPAMSRAGVPSRREEAIPEAMKPPEETISKIDLENLILQIAEKKKSPSDLAQHGCDGMNTQVRANGKSVNIARFCEMIKGKKLQKLTVDYSKQEGSSCISYFKVDYKRNKILGVF